MLCYQLDKGEIDNGEFTGGLCVLTGKKPEEVMGILKGVKGTRPKMTRNELDKKAIALFIKRHGIEAYESGEIGETLERIEQRAEEYDPVFLSKHPELRGKSIIVYHDPLTGEDWAVVNNETGEVVEVFNEEILKGIEARAAPVTPAIKITDISQWAKNMDMFISQVKFGTGSWKDSSVYGGIQNLIKLLKPGDTVFVKKVTLETTLFYSVENVNGKIEVTDRSYPTEELNDPKKD